MLQDLVHVADADLGGRGQAPHARADLVAQAEDAAVEPVGGGNRSTTCTVAGAPPWTPPTGTGIGMIRTPTWIGTPNGPGWKIGTAESRR